MELLASVRWLAKRGQSSSQYWSPSRVCSLAFVGIAAFFYIEPVLPAFYLPVYSHLKVCCAHGAGIAALDLSTAMSRQDCHGFSARYAQKTNQPDSVKKTKKVCTGVMHA